MQAFSSYRGIALHPLFREQFRTMAAWKIIDHLGEIPILMMQGEKDTTVTINHHEAFKQACRYRENTRFIHFADEEHTLGASPFFPEVIQEILSWFKKYL